MFRFPAAAILLLAAAGTAKAQSCGDTVTHDITLTADLHCTSGWAALYVPTSGITIDLNGHTLSGTRALEGISLYQATEVTIVNGTIKGFWSGVNGLRAHGLTVEEVAFVDLDVGASLNHTESVRIGNSYFGEINGTAIALAVPRVGYGTAGGHQIAYNQFEKVGTGIELCGYGNSHSEIVGNKMDGVIDYGIHLAGSGSNLIEGNRLFAVENAGIVLRGSRGNLIDGNLVAGYRVGLSMVPQFADCDTGPLTSPVVRDNEVYGNTLIELQTGIVMGIGLSSQPWVYKNRIGSNKIYDDGIGIYFQTDGSSNDATGNAYQGTATPISDYGRYNRY